MIVEIKKSVPGLVNFRHLLRGQTTEVDDTTGLSLIKDGYADEVVRATPDKTSETASAGRNSRARRTP